MLRISRLTDHAIVVLAHLARDAGGDVVPATAIAEATSLPAPTTAKVLKALCRAGLVRSVRGAAGGYGLARDPADIQVADVIESVEGPLGLTACSVEGGEPCAVEHLCQVSGHWPRINDAVRAALEAVSILDLSRPAPSQPVAFAAHRGA